MLMQGGLFLDWNATQCRKQVTAFGDVCFHRLGLLQQLPAPLRIHDRRSTHGLHNLKTILVLFEHFLNFVITEQWAQRNVELLFLECDMGTGVRIDSLRDLFRRSKISGSQTLRKLVKASAQGRMIGVKGFE